MFRLLAIALLAICALASGCCHCYQRHYYPGRGPIAAALAPSVKQMVGCPKGCGDIYWGEWNSDPPDDCDPCCNGNWVGPRDCCSGRPHTRLCLVNVFNRFRGIRGSCLGYGGDGCCGDGSCGGCSSCGDGMEWSGGEMEYSEGMEYAEPGVEYAPAMTQQQYSAPRSSGPDAYSPEWDRAVPRPIPGVPTRSGRKPGTPRSVQNSRGMNPIRPVSYEEEEATEPVAEEVTPRVAHPWEPSRPEAKSAARDEREPARQDEILPDVRAKYRR